MCALPCNEYIVSADNPPTVYINTSPVTFSTGVVLYWSEYCIVMPLRISGGLHCKVTELELTETISNELGSLGTANKRYNTG